MRDTELVLQDINIPFFKIRPTNELLCIKVTVFLLMKDFQRTKRLFDN